MAGKRKYQITDPAEARRKLREIERDPSRWGVNTDSLSLVANADVATVAETRKTVARAQRYDVFALLHGRGTLSPQLLVSVRRLQDDIAIRTRTDGKPEPMLVQGNHRSVELVTARSLKAATDVDRVMGVSAEKEDVGLGIQRQMWRDLLEALCGCPVANWRPTVQRVTGEHRKPQQANYVIRACEALNTAYGEIDRRERVPVKAVA